MKKTSFVVAALAVLGTAGTASAQARLPLSVGISGEAAFPTGDFADNVENGVGFTASAALQLVPGFAAYGSYSRTTFGVDGVDDVDVIDQGFSAGLTASLGGGLVGRAQPYVGAGLLFHELEDDNGNEFGDAKMGFEVGAGVNFPLGRRISVSPSVGYRQYNVEGSFLGVPTGERNVSYLTGGIGLNLSF
jgi:opacity protein-like surface antigen